MYTRIIFTLSLLSFSSINSQNIHPLEPSQTHYKTLGALNDRPNADQSHLDDISFPMAEANSGYTLYTNAAPAYLTSDQVNTLKTSLKFPANSSDQTRAELDFLMEWQEKRTEQQVDRSVNFLAPIGYWPHIDHQRNHSRYQENLRHLFYGGRAVLGDHCTAERYPHSAKLLRGVTKDMRIMEFTVKYHLLRARPYHLEPKLRPLARMASPSFASGHTLWAYIHAFTWSELVPEKREAFLKVAYEVGESREIMGIHYPSDEEAARILAHNMLNAMMKNEAFRRDLALAKEEWKEK